MALQLRFTGPRGAHSTRVPRTRRGPRRSLRLRMVATVVAGVIVAVLACGLTMRAVTLRSQTDQVRDKITAQLTQARIIYRDTGVLTLDAVVDDPQLPAGARESASAGSMVTQLGRADDGHDYLWAASPLTVGGHDVVISIRYSQAEYDNLTRQIDRTVVVALIVTAIVVAGVAGLVAGRTSRRLTKGAQAARAIAGGDTSVKITAVIPPADDEVQDFAQAVDTAVERLAERIRAEQHFAADLAHELRTPLTGLLGAANLLEEDSRAAQLVRERANRLHLLIEDLLEIARTDQATAEVAWQDANVTAVVVSQLNNMEAAGSITADQVTLISPDPQPVWRTDGRRLSRILGNLVSNGLRHGAAPIDITVSPDSLTVEDHGPGFPAPLLASGPTRFNTSATSGMGLGLVIAVSQARLIGMELVLSNTPTGARAQLVFSDPHTPTPSSTTS